MLEGTVFRVSGSPKNSVFNTDGIYKFSYKRDGYIEWRIEGDPYGNFIRFIPERGWILSWYDNKTKTMGCKPPERGWQFNGGRSKPSNLGNSIRVEEVNVKKIKKIVKKNSKFSKLLRFKPKVSYANKSVQAERKSR